MLPLCLKSPSASAIGQWMGIAMIGSRSKRKQAAPEAQDAPADKEQPDWLEPQKAYLRLTLAAGLKDAEIARCAGFGHRKEISRMRHGHRQITKAMVNAVRGIGRELAALEPPPCKD